MSDAIGEGDWVRCVDAGGAEAWLVEDEVYRVEHVYTGYHMTFGLEGAAFDLEGITPPDGPDGTPCGFGAYRFTPLGGGPVAVARRETADA